MEHRMDLQGAWQQELVGRFSDGPDDWVGPETTNIQFGRRAPGRYVGEAATLFVLERDLVPVGDADWRRPPSLS